MSTDPVNKINFREKDGGQNALDLLFGAFWDTDDQLCRNKCISTICTYNIYHKHLHAQFKTKFCGNKVQFQDILISVISNMFVSMLQKTHTDIVYYNQDTT